MLSSVSAVKARDLNKQMTQLRRRWTKSSRHDADWHSFVGGAILAGEGAWAAATTSQQTQKVRSLEFGPNPASFEEATYRLAQMVFELDGHIRVSPAVSHPKFPDYWKNYLWLEENIIQRLSVDDKYVVLETEPDELIYPDHSNNTSILAIGGPVVHGLSQIALEYDFVLDNTGYTLKRRSRTSFELPFEYVSHLERNAREELGLQNVPNLQNPKTLPSWGIRDVVNGDLYIPGAKGDLAKDYLLLSVLPNFLSTEAYENGQKIVVAGGCHIIGSTGIDLVLASSNALSVLATESDKFDYWQAIIPISEIERFGSTPFASAIDENRVLVRQVEVNSAVLNELLTANRLMPERTTFFGYGRGIHQDPSLGDKGARNQNNLREVTPREGWSKVNQSKKNPERKVEDGQGAVFKTEVGAAVSKVGDYQMKYPLLDQLDNVSFPKRGASEPRPIGANSRNFLQNLDSTKHTHKVYNSRIDTYGIGGRLKGGDEEESKLEIESIASQLGAKKK